MMPIVSALPTDLSLLPRDAAAISTKEQNYPQTNQIGIPSILSLGIS